jgi:hypothetical protein
VTPCGGIAPGCSGSCPFGLVCVGFAGDFCACM